MVLAWQRGSTVVTMQTRGSARSPEPAVGMPERGKRIAGVLGVVGPSQAPVARPVAAEGRTELSNHSCDGQLRDNKRSSGLAPLVAMRAAAQGGRLQ